MFTNTDEPPCPTQEFLPPMERWVQWGGVWIVGIMLAASTLSSIAQYRMTVKAPATVRPLGELRLVQAETTGTVVQINVTEHQKVRRGDVMARIDDAKLQTQKNQLEQRIRIRQLQLAQVDTFLAKERHAGIQLQQLQLQNQLMLDTQTLNQVKLDLSKTKIVAMLDGAIAKLTLRNGQTVQPGNEIAQIVPNNSLLVIKAWVSTQDISQIRVGQITQLRLSACPYPDYGALPGTVKTIAPDATPTSPSSIPLYEVTVAPERLVLNQQGKICQVQVGMTGQIDIVTQQDTMLRAFLRKARLTSNT
ncbi:hypothetical protein DSM106972_015060 [Dulcicalothrix desertica PCC 7102]|uniref:Uncharacterized protein n=1 Tax=Dulcicalothrix desertica PCC 7102 TaxID=232991 RepID=A0A3S1CIT7_9CYAN|nr:HlyD family efflux transporter periplasmic adaptor subunit [Dulcicalothrix desertica]RUT08338.1 hypothetical protein DSM106972_015060 [Dulcicalothrix desertica PCC 7102]TWH40203.1 HlyD family secretion protein [Dulcicalothrix desertica PCC 7102]